MYEKIGCGLRGTPGTSIWKDVLKIASAARMNRELELMAADPSLPPISIDKVRGYIQRCVSLSCDENRRLWIFAINRKRLEVSIQLDTI